MSHQPTGLSGRIALVTGGSRGIGRAICIALAEHGAKVVVNYTSRKEAADETVDIIESQGGQAIAVKFDVKNRDETSATIKDIGKQQGGIDILVNNAGIAINGLMMRVKPTHFDDVINVNLGGVMWCSQVASSFILKAKEHGRIINISSVIGEIGNVGQSVYSASKAGVIGLTKSMAREFSSRGVCVNAVAPGLIETEMISTQMSEDMRQTTIEQIPLKRIGLPQDVAGVVAFLASPSASYITGQVIRVNGGMLM